MLTKADVALRDLTQWREGSEADFYYYVREFFLRVFRSKKNGVKIEERGRRGIPDISLCPKDARPKDGVFWVVGEVKKIPRAFRDASYRTDQWENQLERCMAPNFTQIRRALAARRVGVTPPHHRDSHLDR